MLRLLACGTSLVVDRYAYSGLAYTAAKAVPQLGADFCRPLEAGLPAPDLVLYMELSPEASAARGGYGGERYEKVDFQRKASGRAAGGEKGGRAGGAHLCGHACRGASRPRRTGQGANERRGGWLGGWRAQATAGGQSHRLCSQGGPKGMVLLRVCVAAATPLPAF